MPDEPWVNFSDPTEDIDRVIFLRADRQERVHLYERRDGTFGCRNFVWVKDEYYDGWTVGGDWGHRYDTLGTAIREACGRYPWIGQDVNA